MFKEVRFKFFNQYYMYPEHIKALKDSRKIHVKNKLIEHGDNFIEIVKMGKSIKIKQEDDELLKMIENIKIMDEWEQMQYTIKTGIWANYIYDELPNELKKYMREIDSYYSEVDYSKWKKQIEDIEVEAYDVREEKFWYWFLVNKVAETKELQQEFKRMIREDDALLDHILENIKMGNQYDYKKDYEQYVLLGKPLPYNDEINARKSAKRAYKQVMGYFKTNIHMFRMFITLTFANEVNKDKLEEINENREAGGYDFQLSYVDPKNFEECKKAFSNMVNRISRKAKRRGIPFEYVAVWELHDSGNYHFHMLCTEMPTEFLYDMPKWLDFDYKENKYNNGKGLRDWKHGKSDVQEIRSKERISNYVTKYIIKSFVNLDEKDYQKYLHQKKYFCSKGLNKSAESYISDSKVESVMEEMKAQKKEPYRTSYENYYNKSTIERYYYTIIEDQVI